MKRRKRMNITFLGATKTVTGSNFLVEGAGKKFLVDCGLYQGKASDILHNEDEFLFNPTEIDFMLLTHAHIDHSGRIPKLYLDGFRNQIIATKATVDLCSIMLPDSGHIQETEAEWKNKKRKRKGEKPLPPLYTAQDALDSLELFRPVSYDEIVTIDENIQVRFNDAGHMLGSSIIEVWITENGETKKIVFTGDLGNNDIPLLDSPTMIESADYLVMESTYGSRLHIRNAEKAKIFLDIVSKTIERGGTVVIPSFAVGRTQEILYEINKIKEIEGDNEEFKHKYEELMSVPVYVDSPLAISATEIFKKNANLFEEEVRKEIESGDNPLEFPNLHFTRTAEESKELNERTEPAIIISASGMCEVGRIKHHLKHNLWNPKSTILFVGYQAPGTLGRNLVDGAKRVKILGEEIAVEAEVEYIEGYSGHADQEWLMNFIYSFITKPKHIFLVHGEPESEEVLKEKIEQDTKIPVTTPEFGDVINLDSLKTVSRLQLPDEHKYIRLEVVERLETLKEEIDEMSNIVKEEMLTEDVKDEKLVALKQKIKDLEKQIVEIIS